MGNLYCIAKVSSAMVTYITCRASLLSTRGKVGLKPGIIQILFLTSKANGTTN